MLFCGRNPAETIHRNRTCEYPENPLKPLPLFHDEEIGALLILSLIAEHLLTIAGFLLAVALITQILREHRRPGGALAWVLTIVLIPYIGVPLYLLIGGRKLGRRVQKKTALYESETGIAQPETPSCNCERILISSGVPPARAGNRITLHFNGETAFAALMELIESAQRSIHATTFILGRDETGRAIVNALARKAAAGVEVKLLLDSLGCLRSGGRFVAPIVAAGGKVGHFLPVLPLRRKWSANLRNHRKMVVVDAESAMAGGMNMATAFMGPHPRPDRFLDAAVFLKGPAAADIDAVFLQDWEYATDELMPEPAPAASYAAQGNARVHVVASGPDVPEDALHDALLTACMDARERIWVATPYFIPDEPILKALALQARAGRDVSILVPKKSNHRIPDLARGPALRELLDNGAKVFAYGKGMIHAKVLVFDNTLAIIGSPNLDMRSMYVNFEIALFHYSPPEIALTAAWFERIMCESESLFPKPVAMIREWAEGLAFLAAPLL